MTGITEFLGQYQWLIISAVIGFLTYHWIKWKRIFSYWKALGIKNPPPLPLFGNSLSFFLKPRPFVEMEWYEKYGKIFGVYSMDKPALTVADPEIIKQIMVKDFNLFRNRRGTASKHKVFSKIMFTARDDDWKRVRAIASPAFTSGKLKKMYPLINKCLTDFIEHIDEIAAKNKEVEVKQLYGMYTMDVIARCAFGAYPNTYKDPDNVFTTRTNMIFMVPLWKMILFMGLPTFIARIQKLRTLIMGSDNSTFFVDFAAKIIKERKDNKQKHNDFLQLLIDVERSDSEVRESIEDNEAHHVNEGEEEINADKQAFSNVLEKKLTEDEILAQCFLFFIAGYETTATTLSYCTYELALHPEVQERLFAETKEAINDKGEIDYDVLSRLPYLDAVISETLRNYPPLIRLEREAMEDVVLTGAGIKIEKGVIAEIPVYAIHHDPKFYPDPFSFKPERFLPENRDKITPYTYIPFGAGPRNCIGMRFALLEAKLALAKIVQRYKFTRVANTDVPVIFNKGRTLLQAKRLIVGIEKRPTN